MDSDPCPNVTAIAGAAILPSYAQRLWDPASSIDVSGAGPSRFVQWIQSSLNTALRLRLPVDGIMSASVRGAIRLFQERNGLPVTGSVDAQTNHPQANQRQRWSGTTVGTGAGERARSR